MEFCKIWLHLFLRHSGLVALCGFGVLALTFEISKISVLELNLFLKTVWKQNLFCLLPERRVTDCTGISVKGLLGRESRSKVLSDDWAIFPANNLVENWTVREPRHSRTEVWLYSLGIKTTSNKFTSEAKLKLLYSLQVQNLTKKKKMVWWILFSRPWDSNENMRKFNVRIFLSEILCFSLPAQTNLSLLFFKCS